MQSLSRIAALGAVALITAQVLPAAAQTETPTRTDALRVTATPESDSLTVPKTEEARKEIERTPGAVELVPDTAYRNSPATTIKDVLDYVPGVFAQPKWGEDSRLSIRGSSLSRNFHLRSIQLYMDGIPINTADGYGDFQELDPSAYRYVEVYKGANALRFGANSLGGAINFVTPTGRDANLVAGGADAGSFDFWRLQASSGSAIGRFDYFVTAAYQEQDGFRQHSDGHSGRGSANMGVQLNENLETRFYVNANSIRQRIPGEVTKSSALSSPKTAAAINVTNDWKRDIDSVRVANKSTLLLDDTSIEFGFFYVNRHLMHPIFQWLDYYYDDYGGFTRLSDDRSLFGYRNRLTAGVNLLNGRIKNKQYVNSAGGKGALLSSSIDESENVSVYGENAFYVTRSVSLIAGAQFLYAERTRRDRFLSNGDQSGSSDFNLFSPKAGVLWEVDPDWQVFGNVSRSAEVPSFGESAAALGLAFTDIKAQRATTFEIGTRGQRDDYSWDVAVYRAHIKNELLCLVSAFGTCNVTNADRTIHQGLELGGSASLLKGLFVGGGAPDRLWLQLAYTFNDFRFDDDNNFGDNELPGAPRHYLRAELLYKHPSGFYFGPNIEWVPEAYFVDSANTVDTQAYALFGLKLGYDAESFSIYVEGRNLGDKKYISTVSVIDVANDTSALFNPGTGRAVYAGVRARW